MTDTAQVISAMLQAKWTLLSPTAAQIYWATTRFDAMSFEEVPNAYAIACYNPGNPITSGALTREVWQMLEDVVIDIIVRLSGMSSAGSAIQEAIDAREAMKQQVYTIIHQNESAFSGCLDVYPVKEHTKVESPELVRLAIQVRCKSFSIQS